MIHFRRIYLFLLVLLMLVGSCTSRKEVKQTSKISSKDTLAIALLEDVENLDWTMSTVSAASILETNLMDGLTALEFKGSNVQVIPALAESWDVNEKGDHYTFHLRSGVKWSDGVPMKAQHCVDAFERLLSSDSPWAESLFSIKGARAFHEKKAKNFSDVGVKAVDDKTLEFDLSESVGYFLALFSHHSTFPIRKDLIEARPKNWSDPDRVVTLGGFEVQSYEAPSRLLLKRNEHYVLKRPRLKSLDFRLGQKSSDSLDMFKSADVDVVVNAPVSAVKSLGRKEEVFFAPLLDMTYLTFNVREKPLSNPIFRRVIGMSTDRDELVRSVARPVKALGGFVPPGLVGYESNRGVRYDPDAAKDLMKHSGYSSLDKYDPFYLLVGDIPEAQLAGENIVGQLKRALGVNVKMVRTEKDLPKGARTVFLSHWRATVPDPDNFLALFTSMSLNNPTGWKNRNYDEFVRQAAVLNAPAAREKLYSKAQHILTETEMPVIPLFVNGQFCLVHKRVRHFPLNALGSMPLRNVQLE